MKQHPKWFLSIFFLVAAIAATACSSGQWSSDQKDLHGNTNAGGQTSPQDYRLAFRRGTLVLFSNPAYFRDLHCLMAIGLLQKPLVAEFGKPQVDRWRQQIVAGICLVNDGAGWITANVVMPYLPDPPYCRARADTHTATQLLLALAWNELPAIRRPDWDKDLVVTRDHLVRWLQAQSRIDPLSPGIEVQALICAGVAPSDTWRSKQGQVWNIRKMLDRVIAHWRKNRDKATLTPGDHIPDHLLHLAPALIDLFARFPETLQRYGPVLQEVFSFYAESQHPDGYWGFRGEAFATGHIVEHAAMAENIGLTVPFSYRSAMMWMVSHQSTTGWFGEARYRTTGVHSHALRAIGLTLERSGIDDAEN